MAMYNREKSTAVRTGGGLILLLLLIFMGIPLVNGAILAFSDVYSLEANITWHGKRTVFANFSSLFRNRDFMAALGNTLKLNLISMLFVVVVSVLLALSLIRLDKEFQKFFMLFFLVPAFIPGMVTTHAIGLSLYGLSASNRSSWGAVIYGIILTVKTAGIPLLFILESWQQEAWDSPWHGLSRWAAPVVFILIQLSSLLTADPDVLNNIPGFAVGSSLLDFIRAGTLRSVGTSQAAWLIQAAVQLILGSVAYFLIKAIFDSRNAWAYTYKKVDSSPLGFILPILYALFLVWFLYRPLLVDGIRGIIPALSQLSGERYGIVLKHTVLLLLVSLAGIPISILLARASLENGLFGRVTKALLVLFILTGNIGLHQVLFYDSLGLSGTWFGYVAYAFFPVMNSLVLAFILRQKKTEPYGSEILKPAFSLGLLHFIFMWNAPYISGTFSKLREGYTPARFVETMAQGLLRQADMRAMDPESLQMLMGFDLLLALVPVALFLIFRRYLVNSVLLAYARVKG